MSAFLSRCGGFRSSRHHRVGSPERGGGLPRSRGHPPRCRRRSEHLDRPACCRWGVALQYYGRDRSPHSSRRVGPLRRGRGEPRCERLGVVESGRDHVARRRTRRANGAELSHPARRHRLRLLGRRRRLWPVFDSGRVFMGDARRRRDRQPGGLGWSGARPRSRGCLRHADTLR